MLVCVGFPRSCTKLNAAFYPRFLLFPLRRFRSQMLPLVYFVIARDILQKTNDLNGIQHETDCVSKMVPLFSNQSGPRVSQLGETNCSILWGRWGGGWGGGGYILQVTLKDRGVDSESLALVNGMCGRVRGKWGIVTLCPFLPPRLSFPVIIRISWFLRLMVVLKPPEGIMERRMNKRVNWYCYGWMPVTK